MRENRRAAIARPWLVALGVILLVIGILVCVFGGFHAIQFTRQPVFVTAGGDRSSSLGFLINALFFFGFGAVFLAVGIALICVGAKRSKRFLL